MAGRARDYVKKVHDQTGYWLNYPPAQKLQLGHIVIREGGVWIPIGSVADRGVTIESDAEDQTPEDLKPGIPWVSQSETGVKIETTLDADPGVFKYIQPGKVGAKISIEHGNKYLLSLKGARFERVKSIDAFWKDVRSKYSFWTWDLRRKIVTSLCTAESGTFLGSGSSAATYELQADAGFNLPSVDLGTISAGFTLASTSNSSETFAGFTNVTPLFRLHKVGIFGDLDTAALEDPQNPPTEQTELSEDDSDADAEG